MRKPGMVQHWKHGWIPISPEAKAYVAGKGPRPGASRTMIKTPDQAKHDKAVLRLKMKEKLRQKDRNNPIAPPARPQKATAEAKKDFSSPYQITALLAGGTGAGSNSGQTPAGDPLRAEMNDNPFAAGSFAGFGYVPDFKGQSFKDWRAIHGPILEKNNALLKQIDEGKLTYAEARAKGLGPAPIIFPEEKGPDLMKEIETNGGFTYDPKTGGLIEVGKAAGYAVAVPGTETIVGREQVNGESVTREDLANGIAAVIEKNRNLFQSGAVIGGWYSPDRNEYMVEISQIFPPDRDLAVQVGQERNQEAVFDLSTGETVITKGPNWTPTPNGESVTNFQGDPTPEEVLAVKYYSGPGFRPLNTALRTSTEPAPQVAFYQKELDAALAKSVLTKPVTVYRGLKSWPGFPEHMAPGTIYKDKGWTSAAISDGPPENYRGDVMMVINAAPGTHALDMNAFGLSHHPDEGELLFNRDIPQSVISDVVRADGLRVINVQVGPS